MSLQSIQIIRVWSRTMTQFNCIKKSFVYCTVLTAPIFCKTLHELVFWPPKSPHSHLFGSWKVERGDVPHDIRLCWPPAWPSPAWWVILRTSPTLLFCARIQFNRKKISEDNISGRLPVLMVYTFYHLAEIIETPWTKQWNWNQRWVLHFPYSPSKSILPSPCTSPPPYLPQMVSYLLSWMRSEAT